MSKLNVTRVQSATQWTASVHTWHMSKPNVTRVQSATQWTASVHTWHMSKPNVTRVQSATQWTASVHTWHMSKPNVTRVQSTPPWTTSVHTLHMPKPVITFVFTVLCSGQKIDRLWRGLKGFLGSKVTSNNNVKEMNPRLKTYVVAYMFRRNADNVWYETGKLCKWREKKESDFHSCPENGRFAMGKLWFPFKVLRFSTFRLPSNFLHQMKIL